jgi:capsular exopolysaccharide synthesis family protein
MTQPVDPNPLTTLVEGGGAPRGGREPLPVPAALSAPPNVESLWHALRSRWPLILALGLVGGLLGAAVAWLLVPAAFTVQTLLQMSPRPLKTLDADADVAGYQRAQAALFTSYPVLRAALEKPEVAQLAEVREQSDPFDWLTKGLKTDVLLGPEILRVTLSGDRGEDVALIMNELTRAYLKECAAKEQGRVLERIDQLKANLKQVSETLREKRLRLVTMEDAIGAEDPETIHFRREAAMTALQSLQASKVKLALDRQETASDLAGHRAKAQDPEKIAISDFAIRVELKDDPVILRLSANLAEVEGKIQQWERLSPTGPPPAAVRAHKDEIRSIQGRINAHLSAMRPAVEGRLRSKIVEEAREGVVKMERKLALIGEQEKSLEAEIKKQEQLVQSLKNANRPTDRDTAAVDALRDEVTQLTTLQTKIGDELATLQAELPVPARVTVLEQAKAPLTKKRDRQIKYAAGAFVGLFFVVFMAVAMWEFRARRVYHSEDVAQGLGMNLLGTVPPLLAAKNPQMTQMAQMKDGPMLEAVDGVRTRLLHAARDGSVRVLMIASAVGGEGKTSLASHLAASLARGGRKTLLVDCDLRNPGAHVPFQCHLAPGFCEALRGEAVYEDLIQATPVENLSLLSAGKCDRQAVGALSRVDLGQVFERFKAQFDFVVVDVCPVLPVPDALLVGQHADAALFVVLRNVSRLPAVFAAQQRLNAVDIPMLGAVVVGEAVQTYGVDRYTQAVSSQ